MKLLKSTLAGLATVGMIAGTSVASAEGAYWGIGATDFDYEEGSAEVSVLTLNGKIGTFFNDNFSGELRVGLGVKDDDFGGFDVKLKNYYGGYLRGGFAATESFYPYVVAGFTNAKVEVEGFGASASDSESDFSYGLGADFELANDFNFNVEYMNYIDKDGGELNGITLGFTFGL